MNDLNSLFENTAFVVNFIISLFILIVFLRLSWNVGKIRKQIMRDDMEVVFNEACKLEYIGKKQQSLETFMEYAYIVKQAEIHPNERKAKIKKVTKKVEALGGKVPETN